MKKGWIVLIILSLLLIACEKHKTLDITDQCEFHEIILSPCFYGITNLSNDNYVIIRNNEAYLNFANSIRIHPYNTNCDTAILPVIDFNKYSLLGRNTSGGGCGATYDRQILKDIDDKKIIYKINVQYEGSCYILIENWNWVYIPKLEKGYSVEFQVN